MICMETQDNIQFIESLSKMVIAFAFVHKGVEYVCGFKLHQWNMQ